MKTAPTRVNAAHSVKFCVAFARATGKTPPTRASDERERKKKREDNEWRRGEGRGT